LLASFLDDSRKDYNLLLRELSGFMLSWAFWPEGIKPFFQRLKRLVFFSI
jgi:hypothetical protein